MMRVWIRMEARIGECCMYVCRHVAGLGFPSVATDHTLMKSRHWFIRTSCLQLVISGLSLATLATFEHVGGSLIDGSDFRSLQRILCHSSTFFSQVIRSHFLMRHFAELLGRDDSTQHCLAQLWILRILQVEDDAPALSGVVSALE